MFAVPHLGTHVRVEAGRKRRAPRVISSVESPDHGEWRSLVAHPAGGRAVAGSNPVSPIFHRRRRRPYDAQLVRRLDPESLSRHLDDLYRVAWALCGSREDAEDLVQETYVKVLSRPRLIRGDSDRAYLMTVLRNTFFSGGRTASRRPRVSATLDDIQ